MTKQDEHWKSLERSFSPQEIKKAKSFYEEQNRIELNAARRIRETVHKRNEES